MRIPALPDYITLTPDDGLSVHDLLCLSDLTEQRAGSAELQKWWLKLGRALLVHFEDTLPFLGRTFGNDPSRGRWTARYYRHAVDRHHDWRDARVAETLIGHRDALLALPRLWQSLIEGNPLLPTYLPVEAQAVAHEAFQKIIGIAAVSLEAVRDVERALLIAFGVPMEIVSRRVQVSTLADDGLTIESFDL